MVSIRWSARPTRRNSSQTCAKRLNSVVARPRRHAGYHEATAYRRHRRRRIGGSGLRPIVGTARTDLGRCTMQPATRLRRVTSYHGAIVGSSPSAANAAACNAADHSERSASTGSTTNACRAVVTAATTAASARTVSATANVGRSRAPTSTRNDESRHRTRCTRRLRSHCRSRS